MIRCDAIKATIRGSTIYRHGEDRDYFGTSMEDIAYRTGGTWQRIKKGRNGYRMGYALERDGEIICYGFTAGSGDAEGTHQFEIQGHHAVEIKAACDEIFGPGGYAASRRDSCFDFLDDDTFTLFHQADAVAREMAASSGITYRREGQGWWSDKPGETMTFYLGSRNSPVQIRVYMRGQKTINEGGQDDPRRIRVEVEVKPGKSESKRQLTMLSDEALFGCARWSKVFMERLGILGIERHKIGTVFKPSDKERTIFHLLKQYRPLLLAELERRGPEGLIKLIRSPDESRDLATAAAEKQALLETIRDW